MRIFEYHRFNESFDEYQYSRTYDQFEKDLVASRRDDVIRFDDGYASQLKALDMAATYGRRVVVGITTDFIGKPGYMTWDDVRRISEHHEIANHSRAHEHLNDYSKTELLKELGGANLAIKCQIGIWPRTYLPTYNYRSKLVDEVCDELHLDIIDPVIIMYNKTP